MSLQFRNIELNDRALIESYIKPYRFENSEFSFAYLMMWGLEGQITMAEENNVLYLRFCYPNTPVFMLPPIPRKPIADYSNPLKKAMEWFVNNNKVPLFRAITGVACEWFANSELPFELQYDENMSDYLYNAKDLIQLKGKKYHSKRNHLNQFLAAYDFEYKSLSSQTAKECMEVYRRWLDDKNTQQPGILSEQQATEFLLANFETLSIKGGGIWINKKLAAFTLGEVINDDTMLVHIEKADADIAGLYTAINQQFAQHECENLLYINREEDMGLEGLRKAKQSYQPLRMVKKYNAVLKEQ